MVAPAARRDCAPSHGAGGLAGIGNDTPPFYENPAARHGGRPEVVYSCKQESNGMWMQDIKRGVIKPAVRAQR